MISRELLEEIKVRISPSALIGKSVVLKPYMNGGTLRGQSPFGAKRGEMGLYVHDHKGSWVDFETGKSGNVFDYVMENENVSFEWAVRILARMAEIKMDEWVIEDDQTIPAREATIALAAALYPAEYVDPVLEEFAAISFAHPVPRAVAQGVLSWMSGAPCDIAREMAILAKRIRKSAPKFLTTLNVEGFKAAMELHAQMENKERLRKA